MAQEIFRQNNFTGGELDPKGHSRDDVEIYVKSLAVGENLVPSAAGPAKGRGGTEHIAVVRNRLEAVALDVGMIGLPNGGTAADLIAGTGTETTTGMAATSPYVIVTIDLGAATEFSAVDLLDYAIVDAGGGWDGGGGGGGGEGEGPPVSPPQYPWLPNWMFLP